MANLTPFPKFRAFDGNGFALSGGKLYTYEPGTLTPKASYTTQAGDVANANPVILDSNGEANVWLTGPYRAILHNSSDVLQWDVDNVNVSGADFSQSQVASNTLTAGAGTPQDLMTLSVPAGTLAVGDILDFNFMGFSNLDSAGDVTVYVRLNSSDEITFSHTTASAPLTDQNWGLQGQIAVQSTTSSIVHARMFWDEASGTGHDARVNTQSATSFDATAGFSLIFRAERAATDTTFSVESGFMRRNPAS